MPITEKNDVYEFLVDGQSGLIPGDVSGKALMVGVCSKGEIGKAYRLGSASPVADLLGSGPLADAVNDAFAGAAASGAQNTVLIAVPAAGMPGGYIGKATRTAPADRAGTGPDPVVTGYPAENADIVVEITLDGLPGAAMARVSLDGGATFGVADTVPLDGQLTVSATGVTLTFAADAELIAGTRYALPVRMPIGPVRKIGDGPEVTVAGAVLAGAQVQLLITRTGTRNEGQYQLSLDGGDTFGLVYTLPVDGRIVAADTGVIITLDASAEYQAGTLYTFDLLPPVPGIDTIMEALQAPLQLLDPEFVHIVGPSDAVDWTAFSMFAQGRFERHRPIFVTCEARLPHAGEDLGAWVDSLSAERAKGDAPFVACCAAFGEVLGRDNKRKVRNAGGLLVGKIISLPVMRHIGRVLSGAVTPLTLPLGWEEQQVTLRDADFITAQYYAGENAVYWGDDRVMAPQISDYRYLRVLRVVFKGLRLMRLQGLKSMFDEAGDPLQTGENPNINFLKANLEGAVGSMKDAVPQELIDAIVTIPSGQDIANEGIDTDTDFIGVPVIGRIRINAKWRWAGTYTDPRLTTSGV